jgi:hypothetical protein
MWTGFNWLRIRSSDGIYEHDNIHMLFIFITVLYLLSKYMRKCNSTAPMKLRKIKSNGIHARSIR